ncbi:PLD nuclease N-terminal domain-containing protein [Paenibacillus sp. OV219]|uniref:PLD nuclease N-terminal domain-containing protein n=1 Tax=Paenibacillus sp. OV219 TaxID=1884377 RepID=UPI0008BF6421|nr:PLD nuclease N-terminal domain-containing protein [Paenibacillus sp. OV219]SEO68570.1 Phospholipase_D-nuclease N-terminal [Paenibacillus sp. OV219]
MDQLTTNQLLSIILPFAIVQLVLMITAIVVCARAEQTRGSKWMWILIIVLFNIVGSILFFLIGRKQT